MKRLCCFVAVLFSSFFDIKISFASVCFGCANMSWFSGLAEYLDPNFISINLALKQSFVDFLISILFPLSFTAFSFFGELMIQLLLGSCYSNLFSCQQLLQHASDDAHHFYYLPALQSSLPFMTFGQGLHKFWILSFCYPPLLSMNSASASNSAIFTVFSMVLALLPRQQKTSYRFF